MLEFLLALVLLWILALRCRRNRPGLADLRNWSYAHRGLHGPGVPENSMAAFRAALDGGFGVELDVHLLKDGNLAVMHDSLLNRTTGQAGRMEDLTTEDLKHYFLEGTAETIPEFGEVLTLFGGRVPLIIELKSADGNHAALTEAACKLLEGYPGPFCMESFDPKCVAWLRKNRPDIIRGQLAENFFRSRNDLPDHLRFLATNLLFNFLTVPDFIAYKFADRNTTPSTVLCRKLWGAQGVSWTLRTREEYDTAVSEGWLPIFEGFLPDKPRLPEGEE
ncbi:glycerophosphodiester phosphodiesterase [bacterium]|nr:glycerophosphodiester phosphodiesterase [bacterium]